MDEVTEFNRDRWDALVEAGLEYTRPWLELDETAARAYLARFGVTDDPAGLEVLCLAAGGGQQSAVFGTLGARVTVLDLSPRQLEGDQEAARHHGHEVTLEQGDMRDLSRFADDSFDIVWHGWSISFVPDPVPAFTEAARVARAGALYTLEFANPVVVGIDDEGWDGRAWPVGAPFVDGAEVWEGVPWTVPAADGTERSLPGPREWRHSLATVVAGLSGGGFRIERIAEFPLGDATAEPGSWDHFCAHLPPWLRLTGRYDPR